LLGLGQGAIARHALSIALTPLLAVIAIITSAPPAATATLRTVLSLSPTTVIVAITTLGALFPLFSPATAITTSGTVLPLTPAAMVRAATTLVAIIASTL